MLPKFKSNINFSWFSISKEFFTLSDMCVTFPKSQRKDENYEKIMLKQGTRKPFALLHASLEHKDFVSRNKLYSREYEVCCVPFTVRPEQAGKH